MFRLTVGVKFLLYLLFLLVLTVILVFLVHSHLTCRQTVVCANQTVSLRQQILDLSLSTVEQKVNSSVLHYEKILNLSVTPWEQVLDFTNFDNESGTADGHYIVPNYVHFIKFGQQEFTFPQCVCVLAALKHQKPNKLFIHTDMNEFKGKYWDVLINSPGFKEVLVVEKIALPKQIFNQTLRKIWLKYHGGDVARMKILLKYGGIYLDSDSYIVRSLNDFRRFEFTLGWKPGKVMGNQIILCHKNSRFLKLWYQSYRNNYKPKSWYYNAGEYPTYSILNKMPYLIHRVEKLFGVYGVKKKTYMTKFTDLKDYYALHILSSRQNGLKTISPNATYPVKFNDINVLNYPIGFRTMCLDVYPYPENVLRKFIK